MYSPIKKTGVDIIDDAVEYNRTHGVLISAPHAYPVAQELRKLDAIIAALEKENAALRSWGNKVWVFTDTYFYSMGAMPELSDLMSEAPDSVAFYVEPEVDTCTKPVNPC